MNKQSIKRILQYTNEESIPLAILGIIEGIVECYQDGKYSTSFEPLADIENAIAAFKDIQNKQTRSMMTEPCLSDE
jgi:hypothetical protein